MIDGYLGFFMVYNKNEELKSGSSLCPSGGNLQVLHPTLKQRDFLLERN